ncbi:MAG TPA: OmpA family protein [Burkholderiaceae bacterium]|jgi:outer membrane protein OmpA-like peptidoglycan-associated protein
MTASSSSFSSSASSSASSATAFEHSPARRAALRGLLAASLAGAAAAWLAGCASPSPPAPPPVPGLTPAQKAVLHNLNFTESPDADWNLDLGARMAFDVDASSITPETAEALARIARVLLSVGINRLTVEGHADNDGTEPYNQRLSERRAEVVAETLAANGFELANITRRGYGSNRPVTSNETGIGRMQNRRAVLIVPSL